jgi:hypothetical protein
MEMEKAVLAGGGQLGVVEAAFIQTALRWERHAQLAQRWLRKEASSLSATERLNYSQAIAQASSNRDRCLERLGLVVAKKEDVWDSIYSLAPAAPAHQATVDVVDSPKAANGDTTHSGASQALSGDST